MPTQFNQSCTVNVAVPASIVNRTSKLVGQTTNFIRNSTAAGATNGVINSGGQWPTNWSNGGPANTGAVVTINGTGTEIINGVSLPYIEIAFSGTVTAGAGNYNITFDGSVGPAVQNQVWTESLWVRIVSGSTTGVSNVFMALQANGGTNYVNSITITSTATKYTNTATVSDVGVSSLRLGLSFTLTVSVPLGLTVRIYAMQAEQASSAHAFVPTSGSVATAPTVLATQAATATLAIQTGKALQATAAQVSTLVRQTAKPLQALVAQVASLAIQTRKVIVQASTAPVSTIVKQTGKIVGSATNVIRNSTMGGATNGVIGSGGQWPTNWSLGGGESGVTTTVVGAGTEIVNGVSLPYIDLAYSGTTSGGNYNLTFDGPAAGVATAFNGQAWTNSLWMKITAGAFSPGIDHMYLDLQAYDAANASMARWQNEIVPTSTATKFSATNTTTDPTTARLRVGITIHFTASANPSLTIRLYAPQLEVGSVAHAFIPTTNAQATAPALLVNAPGGARLSLLTGKGLQAAVAQVASLVRLIAKPLQGSTAPVASIIKQPGKVAQVNVAAPATLTRQTGKNAQGSTAPVSTLVRLTSHNESVAVSVPGALAMMTAKAFQAVTAPVASLFKQTGKTAGQVNVATVKTISHATSVPLSVNVSLVTSFKSYLMNLGAALQLIGRGSDVTIQGAVAMTTRQQISFGLNEDWPITMKFADSLGNPLVLITGSTVRFRVSLGSTLMLDLSGDDVTILWYSDTAFLKITAAMRADVRFEANQTYSYEAQATIPDIVVSEQVYGDLFVRPSLFSQFP